MSELTDLLKKKMNYTTKELSCRNCAHSLDKPGPLVCNINPVVPFEVEEFGRCDFHKRIIELKQKDK